MQYKQLVRQEHLNHNGHLFGGYMLLWVDEFAYIAALEDFPTAHMVTRAMDAAVFNKSVQDGDVVTFDINRIRTGTTSATYNVVVSAFNSETGQSTQVFQTTVTMCSIGADGRKKPLPPAAEKPGRP